MFKVIVLVLEYICIVITPSLLQTNIGFADEAVKILHSYLPVNDGNHALGSPRLSGISQTFYSIVNCMLNSSETEVSVPGTLFVLFYISCIPKHACPYLMFRQIKTKLINYRAFKYVGGFTALV